MREPIIGLADVIQSGVVEQNFLKNEGCYRLRQLGSRFHYSQTERDNFGCEKEINDLLLIRLNESADHAQAEKGQISNVRPNC